MDVGDLFEELLSDETIRDIPIEYVVRIVFSVFSLIESGKFFYKHQYD
jgi:hypothetical protein